MRVMGRELIPHLVCLELAQRGGQGGGTERGDELAVGPAWTQNQVEANGAGTVTGHLAG